MKKLNRALLEKARALIFHAKLDKIIWEEAIYVATYFNKNRSRTIIVLLQEQQK